MDHTCNMIQRLKLLNEYFGPSSKMVTCLLQSVPFQRWTVFPTLMKWWLIRLYLFCRRFQWTKTDFCLTFRISWRPYPASSMRCHLSWHTTFRFMNSKPHLIKISPDQSYPYDIPNDTFCNSQILSQKEDNDASLRAMENRIFECLMDAMQDQSQAMYAFIYRHVHQLSNSCDNAQPLHNSVTDSIITPPSLNEPTIQKTPDDDEISITPPYLNALPIQETPDSD
jgi:hypothetical protein